MKYIKGMPSTDNELRDILMSKGWKKIKEPSNFKSSFLYSIPFMIINILIYTTIIMCIYSPIRNFFFNNNATISLNINLLFTPVIFLFVAIHEIFHLCFMPNFLNSNKVYWGFNDLGAFVFTTEKIKKSRHIVILIMPFILLSIVLPISLSIMGLLNGYIVFLGLLNAMGSSIDCLTIWIILRQVPNGSYIINNGFETYYK